MPRRPFIFRGVTLPAYFTAPLDRWVQEGKLPEGFLEAALQNNLHDTLSRAENIPLPVLRAIMAYLYNETPAACWGSLGKVAVWMMNGGLKGYATNPDKGLSSLQAEAHAPEPYPTDE